MKLGTREKGPRQKDAHRDVMKNIIKTRQQMLLAPWEVPYAAKMSQQGGAVLLTSKVHKKQSPGLLNIIQYQMCLLCVST